MLITASASSLNNSRSASAILVKMHFRKVLFSVGLVVAAAQALTQGMFTSYLLLTTYYYSVADTLSLSSRLALNL